MNWLDLDQWTPLMTFLCTGVAAALSGLAVLLRSKEPISPRSILAAMLFYGATGIGLGMMGYDYLGGRIYPWRVIACGWLVGLRIIQLKDIGTIAKKLLGIFGNDDDRKDNGGKKD